MSINDYLFGFCMIYISLVLGIAFKFYLKGVKDFHLYIFLIIFLPIIYCEMIFKQSIYNIIDTKINVFKKIFNFFKDICFYIKNFPIAVGLLATTIKNKKN